MPRQLKKYRNLLLIISLGTSSTAALATCIKQLYCAKKKHVSIKDALHYSKEKKQFREV